MLKDITLGQYYPSDSFVHKMDPRCKILIALGLLIITFISKTFVGIGFLFLFIFCIIKISKIPFSALMKGLKTIYMLLAFTFILNIFLTSGEGEPLIQLWFIKIYKNALIKALFLALRLILLVTGTSLLTLSTSPIELTDGIERLLAPLSRIKFPSHEIAMMMTVALRFIPTLLEETDRIMKAQQSRGASLNEGSLINRVKAIIPIIIPLFVSSIKHALNLADAMESRCYHGGEGRTRLKTLKFSKRDAIAAVVFMLIIFAVVADNIWIASALPYLGAM